MMDIKNKPENLTIAYIAALSLIALLTTSAYVLIQRQISTHEADARVINLSGRQRMLSQWLTKEILLLVQSTNIESKKIHRQKLKDIIEPFSMVHYGLKNGDKKLKFPGHNSPEVLIYFEKIEPHYQKIKNAVNKVLKLDFNSLAQLSFAATPVRDVVDSSPLFLEWMDKIVFQYQKESDEKLDILRQYERNILVTVLLILFLEALLIFRPMINSIKKSYESLLQANKQIKNKSDELENANRLLRKLDETKTDFLNMVTHDLRTPLSAILNYSDLLLRYGERSGKACRDEYAGIIKKESMRLGNLINRFLDFSEIESGLMKLNQEEFDVKEVIDHFLKLYRREGKTNQITISCEMENDLPHVKYDKEKFEQVFSNLLSNAIKFTPPKGYIRINASFIGINENGFKSPFVQVSIADTGIGIPEDKLDRIFDKFFQVNRQDIRQTRGTGLGLAISKAIVEQHGGKIEVKSKEGQGTKFTFTLSVSENSKENIEKNNLIKTYN